MRFICFCLLDGYFCSQDIAGMAQSKTPSSGRVSAERLEFTRTLLPLTRLYPMAATILFVPKAPKWCPAYARWFCLQNRILRNTPHFDMIVSQASIFAYQKCLTPLKSTIHCPARTTDNRDVLIRLMAVGEDRGEVFFVSPGNWS